MRVIIRENTSEESLHEIEREILINTFDNNWKMHIDQMSKLKSSSSLASYAQKNPFQIYIEEGGKLFTQLLKRISHNSVKLLMGNRYAIKREIVSTDALKHAVELEIEKAKKEAPKKTKPKAVKKTVKKPTEKK